MPWWVAPSAPTRPARSTANTTGQPRQHHVVHAADRTPAAGTSNRCTPPGAGPACASPAAKVTACCSAMPTSCTRSGKRSARCDQRAAFEHRRGDHHHARIALHLRLERGREGVAPGLLATAAAHQLAVAQLVRTHGVAAGAPVELGGPETPALLGAGVHDHRLLAPAGGSERLGQGVEIVAVDGAQVGEAHRLEERARALAQQLLHRAHVLRDAHAVVVEHQLEGPARRAGVVERLEGQPAGEGAVTDDRHHVAGLLLALLSLQDPQRRRERGTGVARPEGVVLALRGVEERARGPLPAGGWTCARAGR